MLIAVLFDVFLGLHFISVCFVGLLVVCCLLVVVWFLFIVLFKPICLCCIDGCVLLLLVLSLALGFVVCGKVVFVWLVWH